MSDIEFQHLSARFPKTISHPSQSPTRLDDGLGIRPVSIRSNDSQQQERNLARYFFNKTHLDRKLKRQHITGIAFSGTIGVGLFISVGELISISGSAGALLGYLVAGVIVTAVMRCLAELVSVRPCESALIDYPRTFVDKALGLAVGVTYCAGQCISMATLTASAAQIAGNFNPEQCLPRQSTAGITAALLVVTALSNLCGVRMYGNIERVVKYIKFATLLLVIILMIVVNAGNVGYPTSNRSMNYTDYALVPYFKPDGFNGTNSTVSAQSDYGIPGTSGVFLAVWTSITLAVFACMGGDIVVVTAGEAESPIEDLPPATRFMYLAPITFYALASFVVGFNVNYGDPQLAHPWANPSGDCRLPSRSPFVIVMSHTTLAPRALPLVLDALFLFSAYTAANTALYVSSRTMFGLAKIYGNDFIKRTVGRTNQGNTPVVAILLCSSVGLLAFLGLVDAQYNQPILSLAAVFTGCLGCVYMAQCIAYLRFLKGLSEREKEGYVGRDDEEYKSKHYRAHWGHLCAYVGLIGCFLIVVFSGWPSIYIMSHRNDLLTDGKLRPSKVLLGNVLGAYFGPLMFITLYVSWKFLKGTRIQRYYNFKDAYKDEQVEQHYRMKRAKAHVRGASIVSENAQRASFAEMGSTVPIRRRTTRLQRAREVWSMIK